MKRKYFSDPTIISKRKLKPILEVVRNDGSKSKNNIASECVVVGRSEQADIIVRDDKISRNHFMIINEGGKYKIKDLKSSNGLVVNGKKVRKAVLTGHDKIVAGTSTFNFIITNGDYCKLPPIMPEAPFEKKYAKLNLPIHLEKLKELKNINRKILFKSVAIGLVVFGLLFTMFDEKDVKVAPIKRQSMISKSALSIEKEIADSDLSKEERIRALNYYKVAEYHFSKAKNYALAKSTMEKVFEMIPKSYFAPAFIAACDSAISKSGSIDKHLNKMTDEMSKSAFIADLLKKGRAALVNSNYKAAIEWYERVLEVDQYNLQAHNGIIEANQALNKEELPEMEEKEARIFDDVGNTIDQMKSAYNDGHYTKAYELANRVVKKGEKKVGHRPFISAFRLRTKITRKMNRKFAAKLKQAKLLSKTGSEHAALSILKKVLAKFPYHKGAHSAAKTIHRRLHKEVKYLYAKALVEESYSNFKEAKSKLRMIIDMAPKNDRYYWKARKMLKKYEI